jgi:hypothetical protein
MDELSDWLGFKKILLANKKAISRERRTERHKSHCTENKGCAGVKGGWITVDEYSNGYMYPGPLPSSLN